MNKLKILHTVESYSPTVSGMAEVVSQISERLVAMGHEVVVATRKVEARESDVINGVKIVEFDISGNFVRGLEGEVENYKQFLLNSDFDVVTNFAAQQWATDIALPILQRIPGKKVFVPTGFSEFYHPYYQEYFDLMRKWIKSYDNNLFLSNDYRDINFAREVGVDSAKITLVPNAADEREFLSQSTTDIRNKLKIPAHNRLIMTIGSHTGLKGHKEALEMFEKANIQNATLLIVGNLVEGGCSDSCRMREIELNNLESFKSAGKQVIVSFLERSDTVAALKEADLFLFPSNIECSPIVLFEAMAAKTPFMVTDVGNSREISEWFAGAGIVLPTSKSGPSANSYAVVDQAVPLLEDFMANLDTHRQKAEAGYEIWRQKYSWQHIAAKYEQIYLDLVSQAAPANSGQNLPPVDIVLVVNTSDDYMVRAVNRIKNQSLMPANLIIMAVEPDLHKLDEVRDNTSELHPQIIELHSDNFSHVRNRALESTKSDLVVFYDDNDLWSPTLLQDLVTEYALSSENSPVMIYRNFSTLAINKPKDERLQNFEFGLGYYGEKYPDFIRSNKLNSTLSGVLLHKQTLAQQGNFDESLALFGDWDMWLRLSKLGNVAYVFDYTELTENLKKDRFSHIPAATHFQEQIRLYNKWADSLQDSLTLNNWRKYIVWRAANDFSDSKLLNVATHTLTSQAKLVLFSSTGGSMKLFVLLNIVLRYVKACLLIVKEMLNTTLAYFKNLLFILKQ